VYHKANYQDFQRFMPADLAIGGDTEASLPDLIEAVKRATTSERKAAFAERTKVVAKMHRDMKARDKENAALGWDASPVSTARLAAEMWNVIKNEKWALPVSDRIPWARRLWPVTEHYQMLGPDVRAGPAVDRRAPQDPDPDADAQQPLLPPGDHARAAHGSDPQPPAEHGSHWHRDHRPQY
jgi:radical SAM superfamily enzyme YgiQ (UPF0313 family)